MKEQLLSHYQETFDLQMADVNALDELNLKMETASNSNVIYTRKAQINLLTNLIKVRSYYLAALDEKIIMIGTPTIAEVREKLAS